MIVGITSDSILNMIYGGATLASLNAASNSINQVYDLEADKITKPYRPISRGLITVEEARTTAFLLYIFVIARAYLLSSIFGLMVSTLAICTICYNMPPIRLRDRLWFNNISLAFSRGMLGFVAAYSILGTPTESTPWIIGSILFLFLIGAACVKDVMDVEGDRKIGTKTLVIEYGVRGMAIRTLPFYFATFALLSIYVYLGVLPVSANVLWLLVLPTVYMWYLLYAKPLAVDKMAENHPSWKYMYGTLVLFYIGFGLIFAFPL